MVIQTLPNLHNKANQGKLVDTKQYYSELMVIIKENKRLKRDLKIAEEEREILSKEG